MRFKGLDLNLLITLKALLEEKSVSAAAVKLNVTQPAISAALKKLRDYFNDELLIPNGKQMLLSPHAIQIIPELYALLESVDIFVSRATHFSPESTTRQFTLAASDSFSSVVLAPVLSQLVNIAPQVRIKLISLDGNTNENIRNGVVDLAFSPECTLGEELHSEVLYRDELAVLSCESNVRFRGHIEIQDIADSAHALVDITGSQRGTILHRKLKELGIVLRTQVNLPSFLVAPEIIINTDLITIIHKRLALKVSKYLPLQITQMPKEMRSLTEFDYCVYSHPARDEDPGIQWLKSIIKNHLSTV